MKKVVIVYKSDSGNTQMMAERLSEKLEDGGVFVNLLPADEADVDDLLAADVIAMGSPACEEEVIDQEYIEPLTLDLAGKYDGKPVALFGSYGWGDGEYMEDWIALIEKGGGEIIAEPVIALETPTDFTELDELAQIIIDA